MGTELTWQNIFEIQPKQPHELDEREKQRFADVFKREQLPKDDVQAASAQSIADLITQHGDFYAGLKRDRVQRAFEDATRDGPEALDNLIKQVNEKLAEKGSAYRLESNYWTEQVAYHPPPSNLMIHQHPEIVNEPRSKVTLRNTQSGQAEDEMRIKVKMDAGMFEISPKHGGIKFPDIYH